MKLPSKLLMKTGEISHPRIRGSIVRDNNMKLVIRYFDAKATEVLAEAGIQDPRLDSVIDTDVDRFDGQIRSVRERAVAIGALAFSGVEIVKEVTTDFSQKFVGFLRHMDAHRRYGTHVAPEPVQMPDNVTPLFPPTLGQE